MSSNIAVEWGKRDWRIWSRPLYFEVVIVPLLIFHFQSLFLSGLTRSHDPPNLLCSREISNFLFIFWSHDICDTPVPWKVRNQWLIPRIHHRKRLSLFQTPLFIDCIRTIVIPVTPNEAWHPFSVARKFTVKGIISCATIIYQKEYFLSIFVSTQNKRREKSFVQNSPHSFSLQVCSIWAQQTEIITSTRYWNIIVISSDPSERQKLQMKPFEIAHLVLRQTLSMSTQPNKTFKTCFYCFLLASDSSDHEHDTSKRRAGTKPPSSDGWQ